MSAQTAKALADFGEACRRAAEAVQPKMVELTRALNEGVERAREQVERSCRRP
jgi:hypothetical protein